MPDEPSAPRDEAVLLRAANARLREVVEAKDTEIAVLRNAHQVQMEALRVQVETLRAEVAELRARLGQNPRNSSRPPSSEGLAKPAPKSLRGRSGRKPGRPKGQPGSTLEMTAAPDAVVIHEPGRCRGCGAGLAGTAQAGAERRQVIDLPEKIRALVTEHQMVSRRCGCGTVTAAAAPEGVNAPVSYGPRVSAVGVYLWHGQFLSRSRTCQALGELFGVMASPGTVTAMTARVTGVLGPALEAIRAAVAAAPVAHFDETGFRVAGKLAWVHSASAGKHALITVHARRGRGGMDAAGVLPHFAGIACHDAWAPYDTYGVGGHSLCNAHALRELQAVIDASPQGIWCWAAQAADALRAMKRITDAALAAGQTPDGIDPAKLATAIHEFRSAVMIGEQATAARSTALMRKHNALARRLRERQGDYLRFTQDPRVPFDNNPAEREIRMSKLRIKVSGCMRSTAGAQAFCAIRSYLSTATKHHIGMLDALTRAAAGTPWIPGVT